MYLKYQDSDFMNKDFGRLHVTGPIEVIHKPNGKRERKVWCDCKCGGRKLASITRLMKGEVSSCGCLAKENHQRLGNGRRDGSIKSSGNTRHSGKGTRIYSIWKNMNSRCMYESCDNYQYYGGKGIKVCPEWNRSNPYGFENFRAFAYCHGYNDTMDIDRIDSNKDYYPENCRFVSHKFNLSNRSCNVNITYGDQTFTMSQWAELLHIPYKTISQRYNYGWDDRDIVSTPHIITTVESYKKEHGIKPVIFLDKEVLEKINYEKEQDKMRRNYYGSKFN